MEIIPGLMSYSYHLSFPEGKITPERFIERVVELGLSSTEWCHFPCHEPGKVDWKQVELLNELCRKNSIVRSISGFAPLLSNGTDRDYMLKMIDTQIEVSSFIGAGRMRFHGMTEIKLGIGARPDLKLCSDNLKRVVEKGEDKGIIIALENHMDFSTDDFRYLFDQIDSPFLKVNLDTGNFLPLGEDVVEFTKEFKDRIVSCHFKGLRYVWRDYGAILTSCKPEDSIVPLDRILRLLSESLQKIYLHIEVVAMESRDEDVFVAEYANYINNYLKMINKEN